MTTMFKTNINNLEGAALDWAFATCEYLPILDDPMGLNSGSDAGLWAWKHKTGGIMAKIGRNYAPSSNWKQGGELIDRHNLNLAELISSNTSR